MIQQVFTYVKFLKDLCTKKKTTNILKKAFLAASVSSFLSSHMPVKYKDPGSPTISCVIGKTIIDRALLDLGASVNILSYLVYEKLGIGELKPTEIILQLADRSVMVVAPWIDFDDYKVFEGITNDFGLKKDLLHFKGKIIIL